MPSAAETWAPPAHAPTSMQVGTHWDAVRVPMGLGQRVLALLGPYSGAVIADTRGSHRLYWLIPTGSADGWEKGLPREAQVLRTTAMETTYVGVPPHGWTTGPGLHWRVPVPCKGPRLTSARRLREALGAAAEAVR